MVVLLGSNGYVGKAIAANLQSRGLEFLAPSRNELDLTSRDAVAAWFKGRAPRFVINAVGFTGRPNIDGTEIERWHCLRANTIVPGVLAEVLGGMGIRWGHVSSGCIFNGARPDGSGFTEEDEPEFVLSDRRAGWYARTKWMAERLLLDAPDVLIWRLRIPFDQFDNERNYLTKLLAYDRILEVRNSISQLQEFAAAAVESLVLEIPAGIYNVTNPGSVLSSEILDVLRRHGLLKRDVHFFSDEDEFLQSPGRVYRARCILSSQKLISQGIALREVHDSLDWTVRNWRSS